MRFSMWIADRAVPCSCSANSGLGSYSKNDNIFSLQRNDSASSVSPPVLWTLTRFLMKMVTAHGKDMRTSREKKAALSWDETQQWWCRMSRLPRRRWKFSLVVFGAWKRSSLVECVMRDEFHESGNKQKSSERNFFLAIFFFLRRSPINSRTNCDDSPW